jgi:hypothetical protein
MRGISKQEAGRAISMSQHALIVKTESARSEWAELVTPEATAPYLPKLMNQAIQKCLEGGFSLNSAELWCNQAVSAAWKYIAEHDPVTVETIHGHQWCRGVKIVEDASLDGDSTAYLMAPCSRGAIVMVKIQGLPVVPRQRT